MIELELLLPEITNLMPTAIGIALCADLVVAPVLFYSYLGVWR